MSIKLVDFKDIQDAILEELKIQSADTVSLARIKRVINEVYINEVVPYARWKWLEGHTNVRFDAAYYGGTVSVTPNSTTVTLSTAPSVGLGSFAGKLFSTNGFSEIYVIESHTAGSTTITLAQQYLGVIDATANFKIWTDKVNLPTDCRETVTVWHNMMSRPMEAMGSQKFRELTVRGPKAEGYPAYYFTGDYYDPTPLTGEYETDRYRQLKIYPSVNNKSVTISIDYIKEAVELSADGDEPVLPLEDRIVIKYGALKTLWRSLMRNPEEAMLAAQEFQNKLDRMAGKIEDSHDKPRIQPDSQYIRRRRAPRYRVGGYSADMAGVGGGGTFGQITYLEDVTINGATITNNVTVSAGKTIDGVDISAFKTEFDNYVISDSNPAASEIVVTPAGNLASTDVQAALEELQGDINTINSSTALSDHLSDTTDAHAASAITNTPSGNLAATEVQAALNELQSDIDTRATATSVSDHLSDTTDAHAASAITNTPSGNLSATEVQAALNELQSDIDSRATATSVSDHISDTTDAHDASAISSVAAGNLAATDVQTALDELQSDIDTRVLASSPEITDPLLMAEEASTPSTPASGKFKIYPKNDGKLYTLNDSGTETEVGAGGSASGINYIDNPDAETDTTGYAAYADAAATSPVNGTGGSPTVTITRTTSSPLRDVASFLITKDAANRQGEGVSYDFTIDAADKYKVLQGSFDYAIASGTYADNDISIWIYDVTNAVLIQPAPYLLKNHSLPSERMPFEFQCSDSTSYRLIMHVASTSASAYTVKFDNVSVGPQAKLYGSAITDWISYTPTFGAGFGTVSTSSFFSRKVGDSLEVVGKWTNGTVASNTASITVGFNGANANVTIDTSKVSPSSVIGSAQTSLASTTQFAVFPIAPASNATSIGFTVQNSTTGFGSGAQLGATISATGSQNSVHFKVPIVGWSSSQIMSSDADTRVISAKVYKAADQTGITDSSDTKILLDTIDKDSSGLFDLANNRILIKTPGRYQINGSVTWNSLNSTGFRGARVKINGTLVGAGQIGVPSTGWAPIVSTTVTKDLIAGDYIELYAQHSAGTNASTVGSTVVPTGLEVTKIQGPAQIAASQVITASYYLTSNLTITTSATDIAGLTKIVDDVNGMNTTSGVYTVQSPGRYRLNFSSRVDTGVSASTQHIINFVHNSSTYVMNAASDLAASKAYNYSPSLIINALTGDTIKFQVQSLTNNSTAIGGQNYINIERVGGVG